jgi:hypothetical protein
LHKESSKEFDRKVYLKGLEMEKNEYRYHLYDTFVMQYPNIPYHIIFKTVDLCPSPGKMFDCLEDFVPEYPISFDLENYKWVPDYIEEYEIFQESK